MILPVVSDLAKVACVWPVIVKLISLLISLINLYSFLWFIPKMMYLLIVRVSSFMIFAIADGGKSLEANFALIWFFSCVCSLMNQKVSLLSEVFPTFVAGEKIFSRVNGFYMKIEPRLARKILVAAWHLAVVLVKSLMTLLVMFQVLLKLESLSAVDLRALENTVG